MGLGMGVLKKFKAKENLDSTSLTAPRFGNWDENHFIPNRTGAVTGTGSLKPPWSNNFLLTKVKSGYPFWSFKS